jgi:hypothetical protein
MLNKFSGYIVGGLITVIMMLAGYPIFDKTGTHWKNIAIAILAIVLANIIPYLRK